MLNYQRVYGENMGKLQNEGKSWKMMLGQSTGWVETNPGCLLVWDYLRSPAKNLIFCRVSKIGHDGASIYGSSKEGF